MDNRFNPNGKPLRGFYRQSQPGLGDDVPCSKCGAVALDTGLECDECGHDMAPEIYPPVKNAGQLEYESWSKP